MSSTIWHTQSAIKDLSGRVSDNVHRDKEEGVSRLMTYVTRWNLQRKETSLQQKMHSQRIAVLAKKKKHTMPNKETCLVHVK